MNFRSIIRGLLADSAGSVLPIGAAALLLLILAIGGGIEFSRYHLVESRMQQACDAAVLAGRKAQTGTNYGDEQKATATDYFNFNMPSGMAGIQSVSFTSTAGNDGAIEGTAKGELPPTLMQIIGFDGFRLQVNCAARLDIANTDVMFVLDSTNSMNCPADASYCQNGNNNGVEASGSRIQAVRDATLAFYDILEGAKGGSQVRYGFLPYNVSVNVGYLLTSNYLVDSANYNSRENEQVEICTGSGRRRRCNLVNQWVHKDRTFDVTGYKAGETVSNPAKSSGDSSRWEGCIEERQAVATNDFNPVPADAFDMDIDLAPSSDATRWVPLWPDVVYDRPAGSTSATYDDTNSNNRSALLNYYLTTACPIQASLVAARTRGEMEDYVRDLDASGNTYHDLGMIWGGRLLSPTGMFAAHNTDAPNGFPINRNLIFLTDGEPHPRTWDYGPYGVEHLDFRVVGPNGDYGDTNLTNLHVAKFIANCNSIKAKNITIWVVNFGLPLNDAMTACASPGRAYSAQNAAELRSRFEEIATQIANLRLVK
ncbi:pilus assembly protein TadG-related protein [Sphingomonas sp.]|uniref:pilus assembly protein TadG-related protein n=1 Tax=Sphingomonas sp. TaxID=28214 RepID=UPI00307E193D